MSLRSVQAKGHALIDAHYQKLTEQMRAVVDERAFDLSNPVDRMLFQFRLERILAAGEPELANSLAQLFAEAEQDGAA